MPFFILLVAPESSSVDRQLPEEISELLPAQDELASAAEISRFMR